MVESARILVSTMMRTFERYLRPSSQMKATAWKPRRPKKGIEKSKHSFFNLALIDVRLPDMEGIELLSKMRKTKPKMRKIIVTGYPKLQHAIVAVNKGADAYVMKPFDVEKIL